MISSNTSNIVNLPTSGRRIVITTGMVTGFLGLGYPSRITVHSSYAGSVLPALILMGLAMGMVMAPSMNTATAGVRRQNSGVASALVSTMQQVGGSVGTAVMSSIAASVTTCYATAHASVPGLVAVATTPDYATVFLVSAFVFAAGGVSAAGGVFAAGLFPSKARLPRCATRSHPTRPG